MDYHPITMIKKIFKSALFQTTSTLFVSDKTVLLVDPNWLPHEIETIKAVTKKYRKGREFYLLFTHSDYDHIIGANAFPEAIVIATEAFSQNPDKKKVIEEMHYFDESNYIERSYPITYPMVDVLVSKDGQQLTIGDMTLVFYLAPGHNADGMFTIVEEARTWIAGDYLSDIEFPYIYHSSGEYLETLQKVDTILDTHQIDELIPGHGNPATSIKEIQKRKLENHRYILELRSAARTANEFDLSALWNRYKFRRGMESFHQKNVELVAREVGMKLS